MQQPQLPRPLEHFFAPAWRSPEIGKVIRVLIGIEIIFWVTFSLASPLFYGPDGDGPFPIASPLGTTLSFALFGIVLVLFHALVFSIHGRGVETMLGPFKTCWQDFRSTLIWVGGLAVLLSVLEPVGGPDDPVIVRSVPSWAFFAIFGGVFIVLQSATEEIIYRGYLMQQMAVYRPQRWFWMWIPSLIFGLSHYFNGYGPADGIATVIWATLLGLACADLTARTGNIGAAIGLHSANNLYATLYVGTEDWPSSGLALYLYEYVDPLSFDYSLPVLLDPVNIIELFFALLVLLVMWLAARVAIRA